MSDVAIRVEGLGKQYKIGVAQPRYTSLRDSLTNAITAPVRRLWYNQHPASSNQQSDTIWALKDVSFEVKRGEVVGIIGRNGAGKSTLLKILSRITEPTAGRVELRGRVGSLLEVGTGFHPELTGRENVYLNGAILGMTQREIQGKFDEIVDFSGVEKFIDTPVKRYSSGMYLRLAFSVAAHLNPEIFVVDEVLAVGDSEFQKKCLGKMGEVGQQGRTVLFVSHNLNAISNMVNECILLDSGQIVRRGSAKQVVDVYLNDTFSQSGELFYPEMPDKDAQVLRLAIRDGKGRTTSVLDMAEPITVEADLVVRCPSREMYVAFMIDQPGNVLLWNSATSNVDYVPRTWAKGTHRVEMVFPANVLNSGFFSLRVGIAQTNRVVLDSPRDGLAFQMSEFRETPGFGFRDRKGLLAIIPEYRVTPISDSNDRQH